jgi:hypothetical protein
MCRVGEVMVIVFSFFSDDLAEFVGDQVGQVNDPLLAVVT